jgi:hypothetical protein
LALTSCFRLSNLIRLLSRMFLNIYNNEECTAL